MVGRCFRRRLGSKGKSPTKCTAEKVLHFHTVPSNDKRGIKIGTKGRIYDVFGDAFGECRNIFQKFIAREIRKVLVGIF